MKPASAPRPVRVGVVGAGALGFHHIRLRKKILDATLRKRNERSIESKAASAAASAGS